MYFPGLTARGGAERLALTLGLSLLQFGWDVAMYSDGVMDPEQLSADLGDDVSGLRFIELPKESAWRVPREVRRLLTLGRRAKAIRHHRLDLFLNAQFKSQLPGCGQRNIYYCHFPHRLDPFAQGGLRGLYQRVTSLVDRALVTRSDNFLHTYHEVWANSQFTASHVRDRWGVEPRLLYPACEQMTPGAKEHTIAVVGRFQGPTPGAPYKAQDVLVREFAAMSELHAKGWQLELVGGLGSSARDREYFDALGLASAGAPIKLRPNVTHDEIRELYGRASLYWHAQGFGEDERSEPQTQEHFGITTVEAMSAGCIPVVYGTAGPLEVVAPVALGETWRSTDDLRAVTTRLASTSEEDLAQLRARCGERATEFSRAAFVSRLDHLLGGSP